ncbi:MAG: GH1 family beta-glucosidase [Moraxellaceae bacterium]|nr:GH1 family beta-glucosidase [Moraxellaceae bacterium]
MTMQRDLDMTSLKFPATFEWGAAASAFQIEGAAREDGRGPSIWDTFSHTPGKVLNDDNGDVACDHYHRWQEDLDLLASLNATAYRFSIAWPRVQPAGEGAWNERGIAFYDRLIDGMLERGLAPHMSLYHWDLPQALQDKGGWGARDTCARFADYALEMGRRFGDRLRSIATHNEPWCTAVLGHQNGQFAPGLRDAKLANQVSHHLLLSHGMALAALRASGCKTPLGIVLNQAPATPARNTPADVRAAENAYANFVRWYMEPIFLGRYPEIEGRPLPEIHDGDMALINVPLNFLGINYYTRTWASTDVPPVPAPMLMGVSDMGWENYPQGLTELLLRINQDYELPPIYITENGMANRDEVAGQRVPDHARTEYLRSHLAALSAAIAAGVDVRGYFYWSLLDNFEWNSGYAKRFGLIHVDYETQARTPKESAHWYRDFIATQRGHRKGG